MSKEVFKDDIGFLYAVLVPNILNRTVRVTIDSANYPIVYKRDDFIKLILSFGFFQIKPQIVSVLMKTQSVLWDVKEGKLTFLTSSSEPDSLLADLLAVKKESEDYIENLPISEKFSRSEVDISDPDNPIFTLF